MHRLLVWGGYGSGAVLLRRILTLEVRLLVMLRRLRLVVWVAVHASIKVQFSKADYGAATVR